MWLAALVAALATVGVTIKDPVAQDHAPYEIDSEEITSGVGESNDEDDPLPNPLDETGQMCTPAPVIEPQIGPDMQQILLNAGEYIRITFRLDVFTERLFWSETAFHYVGSPSLGSQERISGLHMVQKTDGTILGDLASGWLLFPRGVQVSVDVAGVPLTVQESRVGDCWSIAFGRLYTLNPGTYVYVVGGAVDVDAPLAAILPPQANIVSIQRGPAYRVSDIELDCDTKVRATAGGVATNTLLGCSHAVTLQNRGYRYLWFGEGPDSFHEAYWIKPNGGTQLIPGPEPTKSWIDRGVASPGRWTLQVPEYLTPLGTPNTVAATAATRSEDWGVFGTVIDSP